MPSTFVNEPTDKELYTNASSATDSLEPNQKLAQTDPKQEQRRVAFRRAYAQSAGRPETYDYRNILPQLDIVLVLPCYLHGCGFCLSHHGVRADRIQVRPGLLVVLVDAQTLHECTCCTTLVMKKLANFLYRSDWKQINGQ